MTWEASLYYRIYPVGSHISSAVSLCDQPISDLSVNACRSGDTGDQRSTVRSLEKE